MSEITWIKLKTSMFDDEKIRIIQSMPEADAIIVVWIRLLVLAGKTNDDGLIYIQRNMAYTDEMLAQLFNKPLNVIRLALKTLENFNMIQSGKSGMLEITNWEKHQNIEGMDKVRKKNAERNRKYRERKRLMIGSDVTVTSRDTTYKELEIDIDKEEELNTLSGSDEPDDIPYKEIIDFLNLKAGTSYRASSQKTKGLIKARFNDGFTVGDFKTVIHKKVKEWNDTDMAKFIRPETLFSNKFEGYLNQKDTPKYSKGNQKVVQKESMPDWVDKPIKESKVDESKAEEFKKKIEAMRNKQDV